MAERVKRKAAPDASAREMVDIDSLTLDARNVIKHEEPDIAATAASLDAYGQQSPIVIDQAANVLKGNGTVLAAKRLGWSEIWAVRSDLEGTKARAYAIADNKTGRNAPWDDANLGLELTQIQADNDALLASLGGFDQAEIDRLIAESLADEPKTADPDEVPEPPKGEPITQAGDLWTLGDHRLLCGDSTDAASVARLMDGAKINVAFTSPPYASQRKYDESSGFKPIPPDEYVSWWEPIQANVRAHLVDDGSFFVNIKPAVVDGHRLLYVNDLLLSHCRAWSWRFVEEYIWTHGGTPGSPRGRFKNQFEPVYQFSVNEHKFRPNNVMFESTGHFKNAGRGNVSASQGAGGSTLDGVRTATGMVYPGNNIKLGKNQEALGHSAAFPVGLPSFFIRAFSDEADVIYEPFSGSGTTIIAAEQLTRRAYACEISPQYCDVAALRWMRFTGKPAQLGRKKWTAETFEAEQAKRATAALEPAAT